MVCGYFTGKAFQTSYFQKQKYTETYLKENLCYSWEELWMLALAHDLTLDNFVLLIGYFLKVSTNISQIHIKLNNGNNCTRGD